MRKVQFINLPKFWQNQAKTFVSLIGMLILCIGIANAQAPTLLIQASSTTTNTSRSQTAGVALDASGSIYCVGLFSGSVTFGSTTLTSDGDRDIFLVKYDNSGGVQWVKRAGGTGVDVPNGIAVSGNDVYMTGYFSGTPNFNSPSAPGSNEISSGGSDDVFLAKYDGSGNFQWARRAGGTSSDIAYGVSASGSAVYITGYFSSTANFNTPSASGSNEISSVGSSDIFLAKFDNTGAFQWAVRAGGSSTDFSYGVAEAGNDVYITGYFRNTASFSASTSITSAGDNDIFLAKYTSTGNFVWARRGGGTAGDTGLGVAITNTGVCITGWLSPGVSGVSNFNTPSAAGSNEITTGGANINILVAKFDFNGNFQWARRGGGSGAAAGYGVAVSGSDIYVTGYFRNTANFNNPSAFGSNEVQSAVGTLQDMFLAKYSDNGTFQKAIRGGGGQEDYGWSVAASGSDIYVGGNFRQTANFNNPSAAGSNEVSTIAITGDAFLAGYSIASLPIELLSFKGQPTENGNLLTWATANEVQNMGFDVERSKDGVRFDKIGFVAGNGTSSQVQNYLFEDSSPWENSEKVVYYRLKQLDFDGNFDYSNIISIRINGKKLVGIYPNPSTGIFTLTGLKNVEDETFMIMNSVGQALPVVIQNNGEFDLSLFPPGIYYLRISSSGQVTRLVKE
jgi:Secretion system C-terminal sorting domain